MHGLGSVSRDGRYMALTVGSATRPDEIHVARIAPRFAPVPVTRFNAPFVRQIALSTPKCHWIASTDGIRVQAWVLEPPAGTRRRKRPAILEIHGGPHAQYGVGFFHEFQCLAAAGYVVVFSNPRGSKGYGRDFCHAIHGQWGGKDWEDVQAVLRFMQADPGIDRDRMGVMGGSYGGYMTNWAIGAHARVPGGHHRPVRQQSREHGRDERLRGRARSVLAGQLLGPSGGALEPEPA